MDVSIEEYLEYLEYLHHRLEQAEDDGFLE